MPFERPTLSELISRIESDISTRITGGESLLRRSVLKVLARVYAGAVHLLYSYIGYQAEQLFASTADVEGLEKLADEYGISREAATKATGSVDITGTTGITISEGTELQTSSGIKYETTADVTIASGVATLTIEASVAGTDGNQDASTSLSFVSPIAGVNSSGTVDSSGLVGGTDEETDDELRERVLRRRQYPPYGGCEYDFETWMLEYDGVTRAWAFSSYSGPGTIGCAFMMDNSTPVIPGSSTRDLVKAYLIEHEDPATGRTVGAPVTVGPGIFMIALSELTVNLSINIYPNTSAVQSDIEDELQDLIKREGGPGETIYISDIMAALANISSLERFTLVSPTADSTATTGQIHTLGTITYSVY